MFTFLVPVYEFDFFCSLIVKLVLSLCGWSMRFDTRRQRECVHQSHDVLSMMHATMQRTQWIERFKWYAIDLSLLFVLPSRFPQNRFMWYLSTISHMAVATIDIHVVHVIYNIHRNDHCETLLDQPRNVPMIVPSCFAPETIRDERHGIICAPGSFRNAPYTTTVFGIP